MTTALPRYLLFSKAIKSTSTTQAAAGRWHIVLESIDGLTKLEAGDTEPDVAGERLELLAVVRGLEALDQPSLVTLVTSSRYVNRGFQFGIRDWQESNWQWERFGRMVPVKNHDLWRRVGHAMQFHQIDCRCWQFDSEPTTEKDSAFDGLEQASRPATQSDRKSAASRPETNRLPWAAAMRSIGGFTSQLTDRLKPRHEMVVSG